ncbi:hypothetical protein [Ensifer aridi]|uniref:hypothetical protein n=1 Tax=Ensifer aridi TaxID=1708715 RepID=UPI000A101DFC|nr:hypothetical protein [Ensifer aridi]
MLMVTFASGSQRRSEVAGLRKEQLNAEDQRGASLPSLSIHLGRSKTADHEEFVCLTVLSPLVRVSEILHYGSKA